MLRVRIIGQRDEDQADGFLSRPAAGPSYPCDADAEVCSRPGLYSVGHRFGDRRADGAMLADQFGGNAKRANFSVV